MLACIIDKTALMFYATPVSVSRSLAIEELRLPLLSVRPTSFKGGVSKHVFDFAPPLSPGEILFRNLSLPIPLQRRLDTNETATDAVVSLVSSHLPPRSSFPSLSTYRAVQNCLSAELLKLPFPARPLKGSNEISRVPQNILFLVVVGILLIWFSNMTMVRKLQHGNLPINGLSTKLSKFPPLPEIRRFEGP